MNGMRTDARFGAGSRESVDASVLAHSAPGAPTCSRLSPADNQEGALWFGYGRAGEIARRVCPSRTGERVKPAASRRSARRSGFTLIELILVMAILTIAISFTAPALANFFRGRSLNSEGRRLLALTREAQSRAVSEGVPVELWIDIEENRIGLEIEPSYEEEDPRAVEFTVSEDMELEIVKENHRRDRAALAVTDSRKSYVIPVQTLTRHEHLPRIRFLPDGTIAETSPEGVQVTGRDGFSIFLVRSRNGLHYEIQARND